MRLTKTVLQDLVVSVQHHVQAPAGNAKAARAGKRARGSGKLPPAAASAASAGIAPRRAPGVQLVVAAQQPGTAAAPDGGGGGQPLAALLASAAAAAHASSTTGLQVGDITIAKHVTQGCGSMLIQSWHSFAALTDLPPRQAAPHLHADACSS